MHPLTTTEQAVQFWAEQASQADTLLRNLEHRIPRVIPPENPEDEPDLPFTDDTRSDLVEALEVWRLAADTMTGAYTRALHQERAQESGQVAVRPQPQPAQWPPPNNAYRNSASY